MKNKLKEIKTYIKIVKDLFLAPYCYDMVLKSELSMMGCYRMSKFEDIKMQILCSLLK